VSAPAGVAQSLREWPLLQNLQSLAQHLFQHIELLFAVVRKLGGGEALRR